jgi:hypothetical protein
MVHENQQKKRQYQCKRKMVIITAYTNAHDAMVSILEEISLISDFILIIGYLCQEIDRVGHPKLTLWLNRILDRP